MLEHTSCDSCGKTLDMIYDLSDIDLALCKHCNRSGETVHWVNPENVRTPPIFVGYTL